MNIQIIGNYFSGYGYTVALGRAGSGIGLTNSSFKDNVIGTDLQDIWVPIYSNYTTDFSGNGNTWSHNRIHVVPGTTKSSTSGFQFSATQDGDFIWPDSSLHTTDF